LLKSFLLPLPQGYPRLVTAVEAGYHYVRFPFLPYPHPTVVALNKQHVAVLAYLAPVHHGQAYFRGHSYFTCSFYVAARQLRIIAVDFFSLLEENLDSLSGYLLPVGFHLDISLFAVRIRAAINLELGASVHNAFVYPHSFLM
jgi:hypothetical protein